jgi:type I restriction enzyme S subunit
MNTVTLDSEINRGNIKLGRGNIISSIDIARNPGDYPIYSSSAKGTGEFGRYGDYMFDEELITWSVDGGGRFFFRPKHKFSVTNVSGFMRIDADIWDRKFVYYSLDFQHQKITFDYQTKAHPSVIRTLYQLAEFSKPEQSKIAEVLSKVDQAIEQTKSLIAKQQRIKMGLMQDLLTRGIDEHGDLRSEETHEFKDSPLGRIPVEWDFVPIASVLRKSPKNGYSPVESNSWNGTYMLGLGCLTKSGFQPVQLKYAPPFSSVFTKAILTQGDFLISRSNTRDLVGLVGIYKDIGGAPCIYPDLMVRLYFSNDVVTEFMEQVFISALIRRQITNAATGTSGSMVKISSSLIKNFYFFKPDFEEQQRIIKVLEEQDSSRVTIERTKNKLYLLKTALMQDLLTGKVRVIPLLDKMKVCS